VGWVGGLVVSGDGLDTVSNPRPRAACAAGGAWARVEGWACVEVEKKGGRAWEENE